MTMDKSLRRSGTLVRARNVLTRAERLKILADEERWSEGESPLGLPKVRVARSTAGKKKPKEEKEADATEEAAEEPTASA